MGKKKKKRIPGPFVPFPRQWFRKGGLIDHLARVKRGPDAVVLLLRFVGMGDQWAGVTRDTKILPYSAVQKRLGWGTRRIQLAFEVLKFHGILEVVNDPDLRAGIRPSNEYRFTSAHPWSGRLEPLRPWIETDPSVTRDGRSAVTRGSDHASHAEILERLASTRESAGHTEKAEQERQVRPKTPTNGPNAPRYHPPKCSEISIPRGPKDPDLPARDSSDSEKGDTSQPHERLRRWRKAEGLRQIDAAERIEVPQSTWSRLEAGRRRPTKEQAVALHELTGIPAIKWDTDD